MTRRAPVKAIGLVTVSALAVGIASPAAIAQTSAMTADSFVANGQMRAEDVTGELYATMLEFLTVTASEEIAADETTAIIDRIRAGSGVDALTGVSEDRKEFAKVLGIQLVLVDRADPAGGDDGRAGDFVVAYVPEGVLRNSVTRTDIEEAASRAGNDLVTRIQDGTFVNAGGVLANTEGLPSAGVGAYIGVRGSGAITSGGSGSIQVRTIACPAGSYGAGITQRQDLDRETTLGGTSTNVEAGWTEVDRNCQPETSRTVRYFDACGDVDGNGSVDDDEQGRALFETTQYTRKDPDDPFAVQIFRDDDNAIRVNEGQCITGERVDDAEHFLVNGRTQGDRELGLSRNTSSSDIGNGTNTVPRALDGTGGAVDSIPFPANARSDFRYIRSCSAEYPEIRDPSYDGVSRWFRDYDRKETYFTDDQLEYVLNYEVVLDTNAFDRWADKGRGPIPDRRSGEPSTDGWWNASETCKRVVVDRVSRTNTTQCDTPSPGNDTGYPSYPQGTYKEYQEGDRYRVERPNTDAYEDHDGTFRYNPDPDSDFGGSPANVDWEPWEETSNGCYYETSRTTTESRTVSVNTGSSTCKQDQEREKTVVTRHFHSGGENDLSPDYTSWSDTGSTYSCSSNSSNNDDDDESGWDTTGDGQANFDTYTEASEHTDDPDKTNDDAGTNEGHDDDSNGGSDSGGGGGGSGGGGGGCFAAGTPVTMSDGSCKTIEEIEIGDEIAAGGLVLVTCAFLAEDVFLLHGIRVTGSHAVRSATGWVRVKDHPDAVSVATGPQKVFNMITSNNRISCGGETFADQAEFGGVFAEDLLAMGETDRLEQLNATSVRRAA